MANGGPIEFGPGDALIVVDVQNDFADPAGGLYVRGGETIIAAVNELVVAARSGGGEVIYTTDWHPAQTPHFVTGGGTWPVHCVKGTWGAELHPELLVDGDILRKGTTGEDGYSGFGVRDPATGAERSTGLAALLRARGCRTVVVAGIAGDVCVRATATDAARLGFPTTVVRSATRSVAAAEGDEDEAFAAMAAAGVVIA